MAYYGNQPIAGETNSFKVLDDISSYTKTFDGSSAAVVSTSDDTLTFYDHRFIQGQRVTYSKGSGGTVITGLTDATVYYVIRQDKDTIQLATSESNAAALTAVNITAVAPGGTAHELTVAFDGTNTKFKATTGGIHIKLTRPGQLMISMNGVIQEPQNNTPSNGFGIESNNVIVFSTAPTVLDTFWGHYLTSNLSSWEMSDNKIDNFTGNGSTTTYTLSKTPANADNILVTIDGVTQYPSDSATTRAYTLNASVVTFTTAPTINAAIAVRHIGYAGGSGGGSGGGGVTGFYGRTGNVSVIRSDLQNTDINLKNLTGVAATFTGNVSIGGTLTYTDVTNIDSIGIVTAQSGVHFGIGATSGKFEAATGITTFSTSVGIADSIHHVGNTDTSIRFPADDTFTVETAGNEALRIGSGGDVIIGSGGAWSYPKALNVQGSSGSILSLYNADTTSYAADTTTAIEFKLLTGNTGTTSGSCELRAFKENGNNGDSARALSFYTGLNGGSPTERLRINSVGDLLLGNHGSRIFDDSSGTNVVVDIYGGTTAGKRGILALGGRTGSDDADIGTIQFVNENNSVATAANHNQSKLVSSIDVKSETTDGNAGSDSGGHLLFSTKPETGQLTERLRITSAGLVGINTEIPANTLDVIGGNIRVGKTSNGQFIGENNSGSVKIKLDTSGVSYLNGGNIGINETSPDAPLHITGGLPHIRLENSGTSASAGDVLGQIDFKHNDSDDAGVTAAIKCIAEDNAGNSYLTFNNGDGGDADERLRITSDGKIEVKGTRAGALQPEDDDALKLFTKSTNNSINRGSGITFYNHDNSGYEMGGTIQVAKENGTADDTAGYMRFSTRPTGGGAALEKLRIKSTGEVHISDRNSSNIGEHFFQAGAFGIRMEDAGGYNRWNIERNYGGYKPHPVVHLSAQGRVGINTTLPEGTLDVTSEIGPEPIGAIFRKDYGGDTTDSSHKVALTIWGMDHNDLDHTSGTDFYGPMIGFGARNDRSAPNYGDIRAAISYVYNGQLTFHTEAGGSVTDGTNENLRITNKGTTIAYHGQAPSDALTYPSAFRSREGVIGPIYYWPRAYASHSNGGGYDDVAEGGRLTLRLVGATGGTASMFQGGFGVTYGGGGEGIEYNRVRVIFRASRANTTDGYNTNSITFKMQSYYYSGGWTDVSGSSWNFNGTDSERGYRWTASNWISSSDFAGGFDVPSIAIKYDTDNGNLGNDNIRIAAVYLQYARFS